MKIPMTLTITHTICCGRCDYAAQGGSMKRASFWLIWHLYFYCPERNTVKLPLLKTLWELWRWSPK